MKTKEDNSIYSTSTLHTKILKDLQIYKLNRKKITFAFSKMLNYKTILISTNLTLTTFFDIGER